MNEPLNRSGSTAIGFNLPPNALQSPGPRRPTVSFARRASTGMRRNKFGSVSFSPTSRPAMSSTADDESQQHAGETVPEVAGIFADESIRIDGDDADRHSAPNRDVFAPWAAADDSDAPQMRSEDRSTKEEEEKPQSKSRPAFFDFEWNSFLQESREFSFVPMVPRYISWVSVIARRPFLVMLGSLIIPAIMMYFAVTTTTQFSTNIHDFRATHHPNVQALMTSRAAVEEWSALQERRDIVFAERTIPKYRLFLQFSAKEGIWESVTSSSQGDRPNLLSEDSLRFVQQVEQLIPISKHHRFLCWTNNQKLGQIRSTFPDCVPPSSVTTYFFPGGLRQTSDGFVEFALNGLGLIFQSPPERVLNSIRQNDRFRWFVDPGFTEDNPVSTLLRTQITLGYPVFDEGREISLSHYNALVDEFVADLIKRLEQVEHPTIDVSIGGDRIVNALVGEVLYQSVIYAAIGVAIALVLMTYHMRSLFLGCCGVIHLALMYISSFFCFTYSTDRFEMSLITGIAVVAAFSYAAHGILVMHETFVHSGLWAYTGRKTMWTIEARLAYVYRKAVTGLAVSAAAAFAAFGCNALSPVPAMKQFSSVMILNILFNMYFSLTFFPASIAFHHWHFSTRTQSLLRQKKPDIEHHELRRRAALIEFLRAEEATKILYCEPTYSEMREYVAGRRSLPPTTTARAVQRDPMKRRQSMLNMSASAAHFSPGEDSPSKSTYLSNRMVPLVCIFQVNPQLITPASGRKTVRSACQSYTRRIVAEGEEAFNSIIPAISVDGQLRNEISAHEVTRHRVKWEYVGRFIGTLRADDFSPFITEQLSNAISGFTTIWNDSRSYFSDDFEDIGAPEAREIPPRIIEGGTCAESIAGGQKRRALTREEKDSRILNVKVHHQGYTDVERFFSNWAVFLLSRVRFPLAVAGVGLVAFMIIWAFQFNEIGGDPVIVDGFATVSRFDGVRERFAAQGNCDYCAAYQRSHMEFPSISVNALQTCSAAGYGLQMHATIDVCGVCFGNNSCRDCARRPFGGTTEDRCGICGGDNGCLDCHRFRDIYLLNASCSFCGSRFNVSGGGPNCTKRCDESSCPPNRGRCSQWSGECDCHASFELGFFANDPAATAANPPQYCSVCVTGFRPPTGGGESHPCTVECEATSPCGCADGRCTRCTAHQMGPTCSQRNVTSCRLGALGTDGSCICPEELDSERCWAHRNCSWHGFWQLAHESPDGLSGCRCFGQWRGPRCDRCRCLNGGSCDAVTGECRCIGAWTGFDCSYCTQTCLQRGFCPHVWKPEQYDETTCAAVFCGDEHLDSETPCPVCDRRADLYCANLTNVTCDMQKCEWDASAERCVAVWQQLPPTETNVDCFGECVGAWYGPLCDQCEGEALNLTCSINGVIIGCDGEETPYGRPVKFIDRCGVCGGRNLCLGCDGVTGSLARVDECGVCEGNNECITGESKRVVVDFVWGLQQTRNTRNGSFSLSQSFTPIDFHRRDFQVFMRSACIELLFNHTDLIISDRSVCAWFEFSEWLQDSNATQLYASSVRAPITFPFESPNRADIHFLLFVFARDSNRFSEIGFDSLDSMNATALWIRAHLTTTLSVDASSSEMVMMQADLESIRRRFQSSGANSGNILHASEHWGLAIARLSAVQVVIYSVLSSSLAFVVGTLIISTQPMLTVLGLFCNGAVMTGALFIYYWMSWELGVVEQLAFSMSAAFSSEYVVHFLIGYNEYLSGATCADIPDSAVRYFAVKTTLLRIGASFLTSMVCSIGVACTIVASPVVLFSRIGIVLIITHGLGVAYTLIFFCAVVLIAGPVIVRRFAHDRSLIFVGSVVVFLVALLSIALTGQLELNISAGSIEL